MSRTIFNFPPWFILCALLPAPLFSQSLSGDPLDQTNRSPRIKFGPIVVGEDHPIFNLEDFPPKIEGDAKIVGAKWVDGSLKWVRDANDFPIPLARLQVTVQLPAERAVLRWRGRAVPFQEGSGEASAEVFVPLLEIGDSQVDVDGKKAAAIRIKARPAIATPPEFRHALDHSCSPWNVVVIGMDDAFFSMDCKLIPVGKVGAEETLLDIHWAAAGITLADGSLPPLTMQLREGHPARMTVLGPDGKPRVISVSADVPPRWHRLRLAAGAGPYSLSSSAHAGNGGAASLMLYGNLRLHHDDDLSIRAFEAAVSQSPSATAFFNNLGLYFAYDVADVWDNRLRFVALMGLQDVIFAPRGLSHENYNEALFPQGFEISYIDAFGLKNKSLTMGVFLQPTKDKAYQNYWLRFGGRYFGELNYISWRSGSRSARMSGFSVGIPFAQIF